MVPAGGWGDLCHRQSQLCKTSSVPGVEGGGGCTTGRMRFVPLNWALQNGYSGKFMIRVIFHKLRKIKTVIAVLTIG